VAQAKALVDAATEAYRAFWTLTDPDISEFQKVMAAIQLARGTIEALSKLIPEV
jgi:hypothetical protein